MLIFIDVLDADQDGICDEDEISGCTDPSACNYNSLATDNYGCQYVLSDCDYCDSATNTVLTLDSDNDEYVMKMKFLAVLILLHVISMN